MTGTEPDAASPQEQNAFEQAVVYQVVQTAGQTQRDQRRLIQGNSGHASAQTQQNNADVFQRVVRQQALDIVFHQRIQTTNKRGDHAQHQQRNPPPQRRVTAQQRQGENTQQTNLHDDGREQRRSRCAGIGVCLWHPTVQRNNPGQQAKTCHAQQPDVRPERQLLGAQV